MNIQYNKSQSDTRPVEVDTESSKVSVYLRKNIEEKTVKDPVTDEDRTYFEYDEAILTKNEYALYQETVETQLAIAELAEAIFAE